MHNEYKIAISLRHERSPVKEIFPETFSISAGKMAHSYARVIQVPRVKQPYTLYSVCNMRKMHFQEVRYLLETKRCVSV